MQGQHMMMMGVSPQDYMNAWMLFRLGGRGGLFLGDSTSSASPASSVAAAPAAASSQLPGLVGEKRERENEEEGGRLSKRVATGGVREEEEREKESESATSPPKPGNDVEEAMRRQEIEVQNILWGWHMRARLLSAAEGFGRVNNFSLNNGPIAVPENVPLPSRPSIPHVQLASPQEELTASQALTNLQSPRSVWTDEETEKLREAVAKNGATNWKIIAEVVGTKNSRQCYHRYRRLDLKKGRYSHEEDESLMRLVEQARVDGTDKIDWNFVQKGLVADGHGKRSIRQIRDHWQVQSALKHEFTPQEDDILLTIFHKQGGKLLWKATSQYLQGRTYDQARCRLRSLLSHAPAPPPAKAVDRV